MIYEMQVGHDNLLRQGGTLEVFLLFCPQPVYVYIYL